MMGDALLLRALRGAPLSCLLALALTRRPSGSGWLTTLTGYRKDSVAAALRLLEQLGLVQNEGRYNGWRLTAGAWQLSLFGGGQGAAEKGDAPPATSPEAGKARIPLSEGDFLALLRSSSSGSSLIDSLYRESEKPPPLPDSVKAEKSPSGGEPPALPPEAQRVADMLVERTACPRGRANQAIAAARAERYYPSYLKMQIIYWLAYVRQHGRNIVSPGHFIASKLEHGEAAPNWVKLSDPEERRQIALLELALQEEDEKATGEDNGGEDDSGADSGADTGGEDTGEDDGGQTRLSPQRAAVT